MSGRITLEDFNFMRDSMSILEAINLKETQVVDIFTNEYTTSESGEMTPVYKDDIIPNNAFFDKKSLFFFVFPEKIIEIGDSAFEKSSITGALIIPDDVKVIGSSAFANTKITSLQLSSNLTTIKDLAFNTNLTGSLVFPESLTYIGSGAFSTCKLSGTLELPSNLQYIGQGAFLGAGNFTGDLRIPDKIRKIEPHIFGETTFTGTLDLNNVVELSYGAFAGCWFRGELVIPEGVTYTPENCFMNNNFTSVRLPSTLKIIHTWTFGHNYRLQEISPLPEGLVIIEPGAFFWCEQLQKIELPSTLQIIDEGAFGNCFNLNHITSKAAEPPHLIGVVFEGVAKDNFILKVPANSVKKYQADSQWGEFRRISAHYDFSISRSLFRTLNAQANEKYVLQAPANYEWSVESKPDWVSVTPHNGTGKTEITITVDQMGANQGDSVNGLKGRAGEIVFLLNSKDYRTSMTVEQYNYQYNDGDVKKLLSAKKGNGVDIVFLGDCYDAKDVANSSYLKDMEESLIHFFAVEPYKTYKDYFNAYVVFGVSKDSGIGTINTIRDTKFGSKYTQQGIVPDFDMIFDYASKANKNVNFAQTLIVLVENTSDYGGISYLFKDGSAVACCPKSTDTYPYDFRGVIQHEACGHAFGKLADEKITKNLEFEYISQYEEGKELGWYSNVNTTSDINQVNWSHLIFNPAYSDDVDMFEGAWHYARGIYRSEASSCMNNNIPYFSAISRQAIVERIMRYAGEDFMLDNFYANDSKDFGQTKSVTKNAMSGSMYSCTRHFSPIHMEKSLNSNNL